MMKRMTTARQSGYWPVVFATVVVLSLGSALADTPPTTTFYLDDAGSGAQLAGVYTSPYDGQVNYPTSAIVPVICDDFNDNTFVPEEWTAYVTSLSSLTSTTDQYLKFTSGSGGLNQLQAYDAAAILSIEILGAPTGSQNQQDLSFALWGLFDSSAFGALSSFPTDLTNAQADLNTVITEVKNDSINGESISTFLSSYNVTIYSYAGGASCGGGPCPSSPPQEFITVPEESTPLLFAVDSICFIALIGFLRRLRVPKN